jgi:NTP pyrophosphatase (non-canonical NTP hydrolase)
VSDHQLEEAALGRSEVTLSQLEAEVRSFCEARDWDRFHNAKDLSIGVATEAAELLQLFRFLSPEQVEGAFTEPASRASIEEELADVAIFLLRFTGRYHIDLVAAIRNKLSRNEARYPVERVRGSNRRAEE